MDGHWVGILEADTTITSDYIMVMHFLGNIESEKQRMAANLIREHQLSDGGWNIYYGGPSEISASGNSNPLNLSEKLPSARQKNGCWTIWRNPVV